MELKNSNKRVIIVGAGIGGLTAGVALKRHGFEVEIYEKAEKFRPIGIALGIMYNGATALKKLGLQHKLAERGEVFRCSKMMTSKGKSVHEMSMDQFDNMFGVNSVAMLRSELHEHLLSAASDIPVHYGCELKSYQTSKQEVVARFTNDKEIRGSVLIGADGIRSVVRRIMLDDGPPRSVGTWWGGITEANDLLEKGCFYMIMGRGAMVNYFPLANGKTLYAFSGKADEESRDFSTAVSGGVKSGRMISKADLVGAYGSWAEPTSSVVNRIDESSIIRWDVFDRPSAEHWAVGRAALLGDSAHAMVPTLGQGANQTMEDAIFLADSLARISDPTQALKIYEKRRKLRAHLIVSCANWLTIMGSSRNRAVCEMRDLFMQLAPKSISKMFGWVQKFPEKSLRKENI